jgi:signal transduction histidine kinase/ActR/RegA family two-component response regulator
LGRLVRNDDHADVVQQLGLASFMMVPLLASEKPLGVMTFVLSSPARSYDDRDIAMAEDLARRCAMAVENARLHQQTLEALRARDEFLAVLSHELRSPLGAILGWTHLLQGEGTDSQLLKHGLAVIERNTRAQVQLVQDLLEVSRIITGRLHLEMVPVTLSEVIESVLLSMEPTSEAKSIEVHFSNSAPELQVLGDAARLQQVIWNLVSNAVKFTPQGGRVEVSLSSDGATGIVTVRDSGEGIGEDFLPYVFDRFRQADSSSTRSHGGLGLGLAIVRHLSEMHGGSVQAASDGPGQGATFTVRLPVRPETSTQADAALASAPNPATTSVSGAGALNGRKILLVEDGDDAREILAAILRRAGARVVTAHSAKSAMQMLEERTPDLLLSDIGMPDEDGYALLGRVQEWSQQRGLHIPAIALTAYAAEQDKQRAKEAGFCLHLSKPVSPSRLIEAVAEILASASSA